MPTPMELMLDQMAKHRAKYDRLLKRVQTEQPHQTIAIECLSTTVAMLDSWLDVADLILKMEELHLMDAFCSGRDEKISFKRFLKEKYDREEE